MGFLDWIFKSRAHFNQATDHWRKLRDALITGDSPGAQAALFQVIGLCQEAIAKNPKKQGDAYVLLANALLQARRVHASADEDLITAYAAAVIYSWWTLPHRGPPITTSQNCELGLRWYQQILGRIEQGGTSNAESVMVEHHRTYGDIVSFPRGLHIIVNALLGKERPVSEPDSESSDAGEFFDSVGANLIRNLIKVNRNGQMGVDIRVTINSVGIALTVGFVLARLHREKFIRAFHSLLLERIDSSQMEKIAAETQNLSQSIIGMASFNLHAFGRIYEKQPYVAALIAIEEVAHSCLLGVRLGLFAPGAPADVENELGEFMQQVGLLDPRDEKTRTIAQALLDAHEGTWGPPVLSEKRREYLVLNSYVLGPLRGENRPAVGFQECTKCGGFLRVTEYFPAYIEKSECEECGLVHASGLSKAVDVFQQEAQEGGWPIIVRVVSER